MNELEGAAPLFSAEVFLVAQDLAAHDDFNILPQFSRFEQGEIPAMPKGVSLLRNRVGGMQYISLVPADHLTRAEMESLVEEAKQAAFADKVLLHTKTPVKVGLCFIFAQPQTDETLSDLARLGGYQGFGLSKKGAASCGIDLARGVIGPVPDGQSFQDIDFDRLGQLVRRLSAEPPAGDLQLRTPAQWEALLHEFGKRRREVEVQALRPRQKTPVTYALLAVTALVFALVLNGGDLSDYVLYYGLMIPEFIREGDYWRLLTPVFLHAGVQHFLFNILALYVFGQQAERIFGWGRFLGIYLLAGISGNLMSLALGADNPSLGASGSIFGLFGALLAFGAYRPQAFRKTIGPSIYGLLFLNIITGFVMPRIDYWAHFGGLIGGFLVAYALGLPGEEKNKAALAAWLAFAVFAGLFYSLGMR